MMCFHKNFNLQFFENEEIEFFLKNTYMIAYAI